MHRLAVHGQRLHLPVGKMQNRPARRLVDPAALHADKAVFHHVDAADAMLPTELVERLHDRERTELLPVTLVSQFRQHRRHAIALDSDAIALLEVQRYARRRVRRVFG